jgi:hypothetical protein
MDLQEVVLMPEQQELWEVSRVSVVKLMLVDSSDSATLLRARLISFL